MRILVTGASGYIGGQVCKLLTQQGHQVIANDRRRVRHNYYHQKEINNYANIPVGVLASMDAVVHTAATSLVGPSVMNPAEYYQNNVGGTLDLLDNCVKAGMHTFVFASSAGVYGEPSEDVCHENMDAQPCSPYGWSKKMIEIVLQDYYTAYNLNSVSLRFFNVAGADSDGEMGQEKAATHIIARVMESAIAEETFTFYGNNYPTPDGTCIRDYIHVEDIASGINCSLDFLQDNTGAHIFNLGSGQGNSNKEIVDAVALQTPLMVKTAFTEARAGDPAILVADTQNAEKVLGWDRKFDSLEQIITSSALWHEKFLD